MPSTGWSTIFFFFVFSKHWRSVQIELIFILKSFHFRLISLGRIYHIRWQNSSMAYFIPQGARAVHSATCVIIKCLSRSAHQSPSHIKPNNSHGGSFVSCDRGVEPIDFDLIIPHNLYTHLRNLMNKNTYSTTTSATKLN